MYSGEKFISDGKKETDRPARGCCGRAVAFGNPRPVRVPARLSHWTDEYTGSSIAISANPRTYIGRNQPAGKRPGYQARTKCTKIQPAVRSETKQAEKIRSRKFDFIASLVRKWEGNRLPRFIITRAARAQNSSVNSVNGPPPGDFFAADLIRGGGRRRRLDPLLGRFAMVRPTRPTWPPSSPALKSLWIATTRNLHAYPLLTGAPKTRENNASVWLTFQTWRIDDRLVGPPTKNRVRTGHHATAILRPASAEKDGSFLLIIKRLVRIQFVRSAPRASNF